MIQHGLVIGTSPAAGALVPPSRSISLDVSTGAPLAWSPPCGQQRCANAETTLKSKNFGYKNVAQNSSTVASGLVISTKPAGRAKGRSGKHGDGLLLGWAWLVRSCPTFRGSTPPRPAPSSRPTT